MARLEHEVPQQLGREMLVADRDELEQRERDAQLPHVGRLARQGKAHGPGSAPADALPKPCEGPQHHTRVAIRNAPPQATRRGHPHAKDEARTSAAERV